VELALFEPQKNTPVVRLVRLYDMEKVPDVPKPRARAPREAPPREAPPPDAPPPDAAGGDDDDK